VTAPDGFKEVPYPNLVTEKDDTLYVCTRCRVEWDTFDLAQAQAHAAAGLHFPEARAELEKTAEGIIRPARRGSS
jgi:hypothetical protein